MGIARDRCFAYECRHRDLNVKCHFFRWACIGEFFLHHWLWPSSRLSESGLVNPALDISPWIGMCTMRITRRYEAVVTVYASSYLMWSTLTTRLHFVGDTKVPFSGHFWKLTIFQSTIRWYSCKFRSFSLLQIIVQNTNVSKDLESLIILESTTIPNDRSNPNRNTRNSAKN